MFFRTTRPLAGWDATELHNILRNGAIFQYLLHIVIFLSLGLFLLIKYNKPNTKLYQDIKYQQIIGIIFIILAISPFLIYFFNLNIVISNFGSNSYRYPKKEVPYSRNVDSSFV